ncbi:hypothetical protein GFY24_40030 [Nocardia sp. SYP-A9097]|uniref:hypothetical protein n=1 Tax=Nocardia sp. SYP-A9097 TaxID=2663237 RepID=UPI00129A6C94|nr:hypothetical protein [Nocardia sp. SYP-A9097]MRH93517.1 hypothetical protein [Nocardia sp. SYP-A9097]
MQELVRFVEANEGTISLGWEPTGDWNWTPRRFTVKVSYTNLRSKPVGAFDFTLHGECPMPEELALALTGKRSKTGPVDFGAGDARLFGGARGVDAFAGGSTPRLLVSSIPPGGGVECSWSASMIGGDPIQLTVTSAVTKTGINTTAADHNYLAAGLQSSFQAKHPARV